MSTIRQHLGLLWLLRRGLMTSNPQYDKEWASQAALFVGVHLNELIEFAGGADLENWVKERAADVPVDFPFAAPTPSGGDAQECKYHMPRGRLCPKCGEVHEYRAINYGEGDSARLDFMISEECQVQRLDKLYRLRWPYVDKFQHKWSSSGREAIDAALHAQAPAQEPGEQNGGE